MCSLTILPFAIPCLLRLLEAFNLPIHLDAQILQLLVQEQVVRLRGCVVPLRLIKENALALEVLHPLLDRVLELGMRDAEGPEVNDAVERTLQ